MTITIPEIIVGVAIGTVANWLAFAGLVAYLYRQRRS